MIIDFHTHVFPDALAHGRLLRIVKKHGADKVLFASDSPWSNAKIEMEILKSLPLLEGEKSAILSGYAKRLLKDYI